MSLNSLPDEIILSIISLIPHRKCDLAALCKSSRRLRRITMPILYQKLLYHGDVLPSRRVIPLLLRSLLHDRSLGALVKAMDITPRYCKLLGSIITDEYKTLISKVVTEIVEAGYYKEYHGISATTAATDTWWIHKKWCEEVWDGRWHAITIILVFLSKGLREIYCETLHDGPNGENVVKWFVRAARDSPIINKEMGCWAGRHAM